VNVGKTSGRGYYTQGATVVRVIHTAEKEFTNQREEEKGATSLRKKI